MNEILVPISQMPSVIVLVGNELMPCLQGGVNKVVTPNQILALISNLVGGNIVHTKSGVSLNISESEAVILGSTFTPPITMEPNLCDATQIEIDGSGVNVREIIQKFVKNVDGVTWDLIIQPLIDPLLNIKFSVI